MQVGRVAQRREGGADQLWLVEQIGLALEELASRAPVVIAIDDVHWADPLTRFALRTLPERLADAPVTWLLTSRLVPADAIGEITAAPAESVPVTEVRLGRLSDEAMDDLLKDHLEGRPTAAVRDLLRGIGGHPFWAIQVFEGLTWRRAHGLTEENLHADLIEHVRLRLAPLAPVAAALVRLSAVWGGPLPVGAAAALLEEPDAQIIAAARTAAGHGLLTIAHDTVDHPYALVRSAVYADIPREQRDDLHRRCGWYLLEGSPVGAAEHLLAGSAAGDREAVAALLHVAVDLAPSVPGQAAELAQRALALVPAGDEQEWEVGRQVIDLLLRVQRDGAVPRIADRLITAGRDSAMIASVQVDAARAAWATGACRAAEARIAETMRLGGIPEMVRGRLLAIRALAGTRTHSPGWAAAAGESALTSGRRLDDELTRRLALMALAEASRITGRPAAALKHIAALRDLSAGDYLAEEIRTRQSLDRYDEAEALLASVLPDEQEPDDEVLPAYLCARMWQEHNLGRLDAAETRARALLRLSRQLGNFGHEVNARTILAAVALHRGDPREADAVLRAGLDRDDPQDERRVIPLRLLDGWLAAEQGRVGDAVTMLSPLLAGADDGSDGWPWAPESLPTFAGIGLAAGDPEFAATAARIAERTARLNPGVPTMDGVALQTRGLVDGDAATLGRAVETLRGSPRPLLLARALADHARGLQEQDGAAAGVRRQEALDLLRSLRVSPGALAEPKLLAAFAAAGRRRSRRPAAGPAVGPQGLTDAERRVAGLIADGHTSRTAAAELGISPNTLNTHLRSIFAKLGVRSRVQLINALRG